MKKVLLLILIMVFTGCAWRGQHVPSVFEHVAIPQPPMNNPTFSVYVEGKYQESNSWLKSQIESSLMRLKVAVLAFNNSKQLVSATSGEGKSSSAQDQDLTNSLSKAKVDVKTTIGQQSIINSDYLLQANYDSWAFSIISMKNQEIVANGIFTSLSTDDIRSNLGITLKEMQIMP